MLQAEGRTGPGVCWERFFYWRFEMAGTGNVAGAGLRFRGWEDRFGVIGLYSAHDWVVDVIVCIVIKF